MPFEPSPVRARERIAPVPADHFGSVGELDTPVIARTREAVLRVRVLLERFEKTCLLVDLAERLHPSPGQQIDRRHHEVDMHLALDRLAALAIGIALQLRYMRLGIKAVFITTVGREGEGFEIARDRFQCLARGLVLVLSRYQRSRERSHIT